MTTLPYLFFLFGEANEQLEKNIIHIHSFGMCFFVHHWWAVAKPARQHQKTWHQWLNELNHSWFRLSNWGHVQICFPSSNQETINQQWGKKLSQILRSFHWNRNEMSHREFIQNTTFAAKVILNNIFISLFKDTWDYVRVGKMLWDK